VLPWAEEVEVEEADDTDGELTNWNPDQTPTVNGGKVRDTVVGHTRCCECRLSNGMILNYKLLKKMRWDDTPARNWNETVSPVLAVIESGLNCNSPFAPKVTT
jgi:hypothetical protein